MPRFYIEQTLKVNNSLDLGLSTTKHIQALRLQKEEQITLFNGDGHEYGAKILAINKNTTSVIIKQVMPLVMVPKFKIHLAVALISNDKLDLIIRSSTELGIEQITPIISKHSQRINATRLSHKLDHWQKIIISACEQSNCNILPILNTPVSLTNFIKSHESRNAIKITLSPHHSSELHKLPQIATDGIIIVGPEGGWGEDEIQELQNSNYILMQLGQQILRTETACIAAIVTLKSLYDKWIN